MYGHLYLTKGHLENPEGSMEVESSYGMFLTHFVQIEKKNFPKRALLTKRPIPDSFIFLK